MRASSGADGVVRTTTELWIRALLVLYPPEFREGYEGALLETFREQWAATPVLRRPAVWMRTTAGLVRGAVAERTRGGRRQRRGDGMGRWRMELGLAARRLLRAPGFAVVSMGTLALAVGAFGAVFAVVSGVLLREMPYPEPDELTWVWRDYWGDFPRGWVSGLDVSLLREHDDVFVGVAGLRTGRANLATGDGTGARDVALILGSPGYLRLLGVDPMLGPGFRGTPEDGAFGDLLDEVVLHHDLWQRAWGGDPAIVGRTVRLDGEPFRVVGVMPPWFDFRMSSSLGDPVPADAYVTHRVDLAAQEVYDGSFAGLARVRPGTSEAEVEAALGQVAGVLDADFRNRGLRLWTTRVRDDLVAGFRGPLLSVLGAAAFLLLILAGNLATLFLARAGEQMRSAAVRTALGAGRPALLRAAVSEPILVGLGGLVGGTLLALLGTDLLADALRDTLPRAAEIGFDARVWAGVAGAVVVAGLLSTVGPVARWLSVDPARGMAEGGRSGASGAAERAREGLVVAQVALALTLLVGTGLLVKSVQELLAEDPGFEVSNALTFRVGIQGTDYADDTVAFQTQEALRRDFESLPGVVSAGYGNALPLSQETNQLQVHFPDFVAPDPEDSRQMVDLFVVSPGYVESMGMRLLAGRSFEPGDETAGGGVALIDDVLARRFFPDGPAVGGRLVIRGSDTLTVAGVVDQPRLYSVREDDRAQVFLPATPGIRTDTHFVLALEEGRSPGALAEPVRRSVEDLDPDLAISDVASARELVRRSLVPERLNMRLALIFAVAAMVLAGLGLYGVVSGMVLRRRREIGLRMAMGADGGRVVRRVLGRGLRLVALGAVVGAVLSWAVGRWIASLLFGVSPLDPATLVGSALMLGTVAVVASWLPARRAVRIPPSEALRAD